MKTQCFIQGVAAGLLAMLLHAHAGADNFHLTKAGLQLLDAQGRVLDSLAVRAKRWDQRPGQGDTGPVAVVLDADRGIPLLVRAQAGQLRSLPLAEPGMAIESLCLHRDAQGLLHLFLLGAEGVSEQWLVGDSGARPLRRLATAPEPEGCKVDDARGLLQFNEPGVGTWAISTEAEGKPQRRLLKPEAEETALKRLAWPMLQARAQTTPVARYGDAADDPAIWIHPKTPTRSLVLGTNKKQGLLTYDLSGAQQQLLEVGRINNVDLRQGIRVGGGLMDLAVATQRDENSLVLFGIDGSGHVTELARLPTSLNDIYGLCVGRTREGQLDAFPNDKDGRVQQIRIERIGLEWRARLVREFKLASQPEGCVVHEREQRLFVGEEKRGIWAVDLRGDQPARPQLAVSVGETLVADVEGLAIYQGREGRPSYLVVSSQGNDSFLVLDATPPFALRGGFRIGINAALGIDGVSETDGIEVTSADLGGIYSQGMLAVQDGHKRLPDGPQNFKLLAWADIARVLNLP